jgi:uncharacterized protein
MRFRKCVAVIVLLLGAVGAAATDVEGLNSAHVPVVDRSDAEFKRGIAKALEAVIVKLTGDSAAPRGKPGRGVVGQAKRLVQQFGYELPREPGADPGQLVLRVEFDGRVLHEEMRSRGLVVWGKERPDTLVWVVVDDSDGRSLLGTDDTSQLSRVLKGQADARGIPLVFPIADIAETAAVAGASSATELDQVLRLSSEKYGVQSVLIGHLRQVTNALWETRWTLMVEEESLVWEQQGDFLELLVEEAADDLADALGRRYAAPELYAHPDAVAVTVNGVTSPDDYARTQRYLRTLDSVTSLFVRHVDERGIVFDLTVQGGLVALAESISFGQTLSPDPVDGTVFRLIPR